MKIYWEYWVAAALAILILILMWFLPPAISKTASDILFLRAAILALGGLGIGGLLWYGASQRGISQPSAPAGVGFDPETTQKVSAGGAGGGTEDVDLLIKEAQQQLAGSRLGKGATLGNLPAIFLIGESGSGKTSTIHYSGIEPELLAGHAFQDGGVAPTRAVNFWLARRTVFAEAGGRMQKDPERWSRLVKKLTPSSLHSVFGRKQQAPRAAVVCFDCEAFTKGGAQDAVASIARNLRQRLGDISQLLGISFPVYVVFTRADRVPFFSEYARPLQADEATQVFGTTLGLSSAAGTGVYAEQETKRLSTAFNTLFHSLCDWRVPLLSRERDAATQPGVYEFPREFRKLRSLAVQFMVDLCRPSQLRTAPFLRGFYFTGMRKVFQAAPGAGASTATMVAQSPFQGGGAESATRMMSMGDAQKLLEAELAARSGGGGGGEMREVSQHVFLSHLFSHVILQDQSAMGASSASTRVSGVRRFLFTLAAIAGVVFSILWLISFISNRRMESRVTEAAKAAAAVPYDASQPPTLEALQKLDALRQEVVQLNAWNREGAPWYMRWGLYAGEMVQPDARRAYFNRFHQLMFGQTQAAMHDAIAKVPGAPGPNDEYFPIYEQLKAYLITTSHPDKSTREWLAPALQKYWPGGRGLTDDRSKLALAQFEFYADELKVKNPFSPEADATAIERARNYLSKFAATERVYRAMRAAAAKKIPPFIFNKKYPDGASAVSNGVEVEGAFLKDGYAFMQNAFKNPKDYIGGEEWVLGPQAAASIDFPKLESDLKAMYQADFIKLWREVITGTTVFGYSSMQDASQKLLKHSGNQPPLIILFCEASANTSVDNPEIQKAFQAVQQLAPAACLISGVYVQPPNAAYVQALAPLQACLEQVNIAPPEQKDAAKAQCLQSTVPAKAATRQVTVTLKPDQEAKLDKTLERLMLEPIAKLENVVTPGTASGPLCEAFNRLRAKYPFNATARVQASIEEVGAFFQPTAGILSQFYEQNLKDALILQGTTYVVNPTKPMRFPAGFVPFFNGAMAIQRALYPANSPAMRYSFTLRPTIIEGVQGVGVTVNGQTHSSGIGVPQPMNFVWPGQGDQRVTLSLKVPGGADYTLGTYEGPWAMVQFLTDADKLTPLGNGYRIERMPTSGRTNQPLRLAGGPPVRIVFDVDTAGAPFIFRPGFFSGMSCPVR